MREHPFSMASSAEKLDCLEFGIKIPVPAIFHQPQLSDVESGYGFGLPGFAPYGVFTIDRSWDSAGFVMIAGGIWHLR